MNVLITNDDGINAPGLWALAAEMRQVAEVLVVAPDREQTGVGTSITLHRSLRVKPVQPAVAGVEAYSLEGSPADSVIVGTSMIWQDRVDLVVSGINEGPNLGKDVLVSGTVGAALQAHNCGLPAIALSVAAIEDIHFDVAARLAALLAQKVGADQLERNALLNVNLPNLPLAVIEGLDITRLGESGYTQGFAVTKVVGSYDNRRTYCWIVPGATELKVEQGTDIWAVERNRISVTPIHNSLTRHEEPEYLQGVCFQVSQDLSSDVLPVGDYLSP